MKRCMKRCMKLYETGDIHIGQCGIKTIHSGHGFTDNQRCVACPRHTTWLSPVVVLRVKLGRLKKTAPCPMVPLAGCT